MLENLKNLPKNITVVFVKEDHSNYLLHQREGYKQVKVSELIEKLSKTKNEK